MTITDVKIILSDPDNKHRHLKAYASIVIDQLFTVHELKVIESRQGGLAVHMPSRKITDYCPDCSGKNVLVARYCGDCGRRLADNRRWRDAKGNLITHIRTAHPLKSESRFQIEDAVLQAYRQAAAARIAQAVA